jgi:hypothetical protein
MTARELLDRCILVGPPSVLSKDDYAEASAELEDALATIPEVISVYATGGVTNPGISDLDRVAVAEAPVQTDVWERLSPRTRSVAMHSPFLVDRASFERHRWFAHLEPLRLALGDSIDLAQPSRPDLLRQLLALEGFLLALLKIHKQVGTGRIKVRSTLCVLHALRYSLELGGLPRDTATGAWQLLEDVANLRGSWFSLESHEAGARLRTVIAMAVKALPRAISELSLPTVESDTHARAEIRLPSPWAAISLVRAHPRGIAPHPLRPTPRPLNRVRRLAEAHWRVRRLKLAMPPPAFDLLAAGRMKYESDPLSQRREIVAAYLAYLGACGGEWSTIGFANSFSRERRS